MSAAVEVVSAILLLTGAVFCVIGGIGVVRLPDLYSRTHAASITDTLGAGLMLLGLMGYGGFSLVTVKLILIVVLLWVTSPTIAHALVKAAHAGGVRVEEAPAEGAVEASADPAPEAQESTDDADTEEEGANHDG